MYDGASTYYTMKIQGMDEYRLQTSSDVLDTVEAILAAGIATNEDGSMKINPATGATQAQQEAFWGYLDEAGEIFANEIVKYCEVYIDRYAAAVFPDITPEQVKESTTLKTALSMALWGFGAGGEDGAFTDGSGNTYDLKKDTVDGKVFWQNILDKYGYDLSDNGVNYEKAGDLNVQDYVKQLYVQKEGTVEGGVQSISGITTGKLTCDDGVEREYIRIVMDGVDPTAIFKLGVSVVPCIFTPVIGKLNENGVELSSKAFMDHLKTKNDQPLGAGPYVFKEYKDKVVTYEANESFMLGSPKIKTFRYQEITLGAELDSVKTGTVHYSDPSAQSAIINDITSGQGDYAKLSYILVDNDGYGYIGIQGQAVPEFEVRQALAHAMNVELTVSNYYGELASVNYRTMTKILWAYRKSAADLSYDGTGANRGSLPQSRLCHDEADNVMKYRVTKSR